MNFKFYSKLSVIIVSIALTAAGCASQHTAHERNNHGSHDPHFAGVNERGDRAMGFSHQKTTHRFRLFENGGAIEVRANDPGDKESVEQIRQHLRHISQMFPAGNFDAPFLTHGKIPPGVPVMKQLGKEINYQYEETENGARVRLSTENREALAAIHEFMRFQIEDHRTGDSVQIEKP